MSDWNRRLRRLWPLGVMVCCTLLACGGEKSGSDKVLLNEKSTEPPFGSWLMYGGSQTGVRDAIDLKKEMTTLVLEDSTYSLTFMQPEIRLTFVESGKVAYDVRRQQAKFTVMSALGVDWNGSEPRRLVDVPYVVPWQREPGEEYVGTWQIGGDYMQISTPGLEDMYFKRLKAASENVEIDIQKKPF